MEGFYETVRSLWSVWLMALFLAVLVYAMWPRNKKKFDEQARIPLEDDLPDSKRKKG